MNTLSTPRIILILITLIIIAITTTFITSKYSSEEEYTGQNISTEQEHIDVSVITKNTLTDSDGDGLEDWEEILWGTNKNNRDTNGDGVSDFDEVSQKKNEIGTTSFKKDSLTSQMSIDLLSEFLVLKDSGVSVDSNINQQITESLLSNDYLAIPVEKHTTNEFTIDNSISMEEYAQTMGIIFINTSGKVGDKSEVDILGTYTSTGDASVLSQLEEPLNRYTNLRDSILALPIPQDVQKLHLALLTSIESIRSGLVGMTKLESDPVLGLVSLSVYKEGITNMNKTLEIAQKLYTSLGISFEENESAHIFLYGI